MLGKGALFIIYVVITSIAAQDLFLPQSSLPGRDNARVGMTSMDPFLTEPDVSSPPVARVGMMYEGWHAPAFWGRGPHGLTVERVLRSNGSLALSDMRRGWDGGMAMNFYWHKEPADGFYCIYRKRANESKSSCGLEDCPNITSTLARHAEMLVEAGIDFIVADSTNIQSTGSAADALQLRPWEVLAEEWLKLRKQGKRTPQIAIWQNLQDPKGDLWRSYAHGAYADPAFADMIFADAHTGKKVFFTTASPTASLVKELQDLGLAVVTMWAERDNFAKGEWAFFSPCTDGTGAFSSSIYSDPSVPCTQKETTGSVIGAHGTSLTVSPSYQLSYSSLPFMASGKLGGLTLRKQFEKAFNLNAARGLDYLMVGTFNEHVAQPQQNPYNGSAPISMGMEGDADSKSLWVDMYGDAITRDLEPTKEDGGYQWDIFRSCMRVFKSGAAACTNSSETCCNMSDPKVLWRNVWSLEVPSDSLLTTDVAERNALRSNGWVEHCAPFGGASAFCKGSNPGASQYRRGPFLLHAEPLAPPLSSAPVYRCLTPRTTHLFTGDVNCRGDGKVETLLGHTSKQRDSDTPRSLRLCRQSSGQYYHSLDAICENGDVLLEHLGFVH